MLACVCGACLMRAMANDTSRIDAPPPVRRAARRASRLPLNALDHHHNHRAPLSLASIHPHRRAPCPISAATTPPGAKIDAASILAHFQAAAAASDH